MDTVFFWLSKLIWLVISPDSLLVILIISCWLLHATGFKKASRKILNLTCLIILLIAFLPLGEWLMYPLESRFEGNPELPPRVDGIVVLGGVADPHRTALWNQIQLGSAAERLTAFLSLSRRFPEAKLLFTGGNGTLTHQEFKEADIVGDLFLDLGFSEQQFIYENESRNTYENAVFSKELVTPGEAENWILITSAFHMPRSIGSFCQQNWSLIPYPVDYNTRRGELLRVQWNLLGNLSNLSAAIREWVGLVAYYFTEKTHRLYPGPLDSCTQNNE